MAMGMLGWSELEDPFPEWTMEQEEEEDEDDEEDEEEEQEQEQELAPVADEV